MPNIREYIAYRYNNWLDYATHMSKVHHFAGWEEDLLNDVIVDLLQKPEEKLSRMLQAHTKKLVNGTPTTELDKFVLKMLKLNACSNVAPFRKNTLGQKIISRAGNQATTCHHVELNGYDTIDDEFSAEHGNKIEQMHRRNIHRLRVNGFNEKAVDMYTRHFVKSEPETTFSEPDREALANIRQFLIVTKKTLLDD